MKPEDRQARAQRRQLLSALAAVGVGAAVGSINERSQRPYRPPTLSRAVSDRVRAGRRPNILLVMSDQERQWQDLPPQMDRPGLDWLRERGSSFQQHHVHTTPCSPSRSTIYSGQHTQHTRMTANLDAPPSFPQLAPGLPTLGHLLRAQGYYTAYKGKWHLSPIGHDPGLIYGLYPASRDALEPYGFADFNLDSDPHGATWTGYRYDAQIASNALQWLATRGRALRGQQPWMLAVNFVNPHDIMYFSAGAQQEASRLRRDLLAPIATPPSGGAYERRWDDTPLPASFYADDLSRKPWAQRSYVEVCNMLYGRLDPADEASWRTYQGYYFNCIRDMDRHLLTLLRGLESLGLAEDTVIVYTSDHGEMAGAHRMRQKGPHIYKENVRLPLVIRHPDARQGLSTQALSSGIDLVPTLLGVAGVTPEARAEHYPFLKGVDLTSAVASPKARTERDRRGILFNYGVPLYIDPDFTRLTIESDAGNAHTAALKVGLTHGQMFPSRQHPAFFRGVHDGRYKFARYFPPADHHRPTDWATLSSRNELELYDTQTDPDELHNLAAAAEPPRELLLRLNQATNALLDQEVGEDLGRELPGPAHWYHRG